RFFRRYKEAAHDVVLALVRDDPDRLANVEIEQQARERGVVDDDGRRRIFGSQQGRAFDSEPPGRAVRRQRRYDAMREKKSQSQNQAADRKKPLSPTTE